VSRRFRFYIESLCMSHRVDHLAHAFGDATARIQALLRKEMARNVSLAQARTLATLEREGPQPLTELAELEQVSQPAMSYLVARLELKGQIRRSSDAGDARVVIVSITSAGRTALNALLQRRTDLLARHLSKLPSSEVEALEAALPALSDLILGLEGRTAVGATR
jgi:DNA-binding MarR family transcriptional regulator